MEYRQPIVDKMPRMMYDALSAKYAGKPYWSVTMVLRCRDTGGWCNWEGRADTEEELVEMALRHAEKAHYLRRTPELGDRARMVTRDEEPRQPRCGLGAGLPSGSW
jgi:predicted small metal-binding protein